ncbi:hypothetical protein QWJ07_04040 [Frankia sp. RB7]|nr:hypothetical protein [Frankia sp. RB7]
MAKESWHLDKKVPVSLIATIVLQTAAIIIWAAAYTARNDAINEQQNDAIKELKAANAQNTAILSDMKADMAVVKSAVIDIKGGLKR